MTDRDSPGNDRSRAEGRKPDAAIAHASLRLSGWYSGDKGWSFMASRSYRDQSGETKYSEMTLYQRHFLNLVAVCQAMTQHVMTVRTGDDQ